MRQPKSTTALRRELRAHVAASCERRPGVYRMLGPTGIVLYVGQSRRLRTRLLSYFRARGRRNKAANILRHAFAIEWEYTNTEFGALLRELRLIKQHRPAFNAEMVTDDWPRAYVALTGGAVPGLRVVPRSDDPSAVAMFGPFRRVAQLRDAVRALADATGIRDCALSDVGITTTRSRVPGCLRYDLGTCTGPCIGEGEPTDYRARADEVRAFLEGRSNAPVAALEAAMSAAALDLSFERAAMLRDRLALVRWLHGHVTSFRANVDRLTFRYHATGADEREWVYLIRRGTVRAEVPLPRSDEESGALEATATRVFEGPDPAGRDIPTHDLDEFYLVSSWFRRRKEAQHGVRPALSSR
ncbi:MAG: GIY-YIG nuclease family protein [Gemmatimonas sp.]